MMRLSTRHILTLVAGFVCCTAEDPSQTRSTEQEGLALTTDTQGNILFHGQAVQLLGVNWFGFDDGNTVVDGLYQGTLLAPNANAGSATDYHDGLTREFFTVMHRIQLLGFNTIRLPFSFSDLLTLKPKSYTISCEPATDDDLRRYTTEPGFNSSSLPLPPLIHLPAAPDGYVPGLCNNYLDPASTPKTNATANSRIADTFSRLVYIVQLLTANDFFVVLTDQCNTDRTLVDDYQGWLANWVRLVRDISVDLVAAERLIIDPINEPDALDMRWVDDPSNNITSRGYASCVFDVMDHIHAINPNVLFFVEGTGQQGPDGPARNAGDGLATDPAISQRQNYKHDSISDASAFFAALLSKPYLRQLVVAPHVYPPSISLDDDPEMSQDEGLWERLSDSFGYLSQAPGFCIPNTSACSIFPVVIGEVGSAFQTSADQAFMEDLRAWLLNVMPGNDSRHAAVPNIIWYAYNANAGVTGGIVNGDPEGCIAYSSGTTACNSNWLQVDFERRYAYLQTLGVQPWYKRAASSQSGTLMATMAPAVMIPA